MGFYIKKLLIIKILIYKILVRVLEFNDGHNLVIHFADPTVANIAFQTDMSDTLGNDLTWKIREVPKSSSKKLNNIK